MKIAIIGGGNMGTAIAKAIKTGFHELSRLVVVEHDIAKHEKFSELEIDVTNSNADACREADIVICAVKPQDFSELDLSGKLKGDAIFISIMAGVGLDKIVDALDGHKYVARVMPNLPTLISEGISGFYAPNLDSDRKDIVRAILKTFGDAIEVSSEEEIDKITAISGSGPAYFFYFIECLRDAGVDLGLDKDVSEKLAMKTALGSIKYASLGLYSLDELRERVTSKGGTTEKALQTFIDHGFKETISKACKSAFDRAIELGRLL